MNEKKHSERGSAMLLTVIVVVVLVGLSAAMLSENVFRSRNQAANMVSDEAQLICDAALDRARRALLVYRDANDMAWGDVFAYNLAQEILVGGTNQPLLNTTEYDEAGQPTNDWSPVLNWRLTNTDRLQEEYKAASFAGYNLQTSVNTGIPSTFQDLFCQLIPYGRGAYHIVMADNNDVHGNGVDDDLDGDAWDPDDPDGIELAAGASDPLIDGDRRAFLVITAMLPDGTQRQNIVLVSFPPRYFFPDSAILTNGTMSLNGAFRVLGSRGSITANENITGNGGGQAEVSQSVNAAGDASGFTMNNIPQGGINSGVPPVSIPALDIPYYKSPDFEYASNVVILKADGTISAGAGVVAGNYPFTSNVGADGTRTWSIQGNQTPGPTPAIYYVEGSFKMTGQGNGDVYEMSIIAEGNVQLSGNSAFKPFEINGESTGVLALAGQDVLLSGNGQASAQYQYEGVVIANEQARAQGNYEMNGALIGVNLTDSPGSLVTNTSGIAPDLIVNGTPTITYNGQRTFVPPADRTVAVDSLRRTK